MAKEQKFFDKYKNEINAAGHLANLFQTGSVVENQRHLARLEHAGLLLQQEQRKKEEEKLKREEEEYKERLRDKQNLEAERKKRQEIISLAPQVKHLVEQESNISKIDYKNALLHMHLKRSVEYLEGHKHIIDDINFHDYLFNIKKSLELNNNNSKDLEKLFTDVNSEISKIKEESENVINNQLANIDCYTLYKQYGLYGYMDYLSQIKHKINNIYKNDMFINKKNINTLNTYVSNIEDLSNMYDFFENSVYPLPIDIEEAKTIENELAHIYNNRNDLYNDYTNYVDKLDNTIKGYKNDIEQAESISIKNINDISYEEYKHSLELINKKGELGEILCYILDGKIQLLYKSLLLFRNEIKNYDFSMLISYDRNINNINMNNIVMGFYDENIKNDDIINRSINKYNKWGLGVYVPILSIVIALFFILAYNFISSEIIYSGIMISFISFVFSVVIYVAHKKYEINKIIDNIIKKYEITIAEIGEYIAEEDKKRINREINNEYENKSTF